MQRNGRESGLQDNRFRRWNQCRKTRAAATFLRGAAMVGSAMVRLPRRGVVPLNGAVSRALSRGVRGKAGTQADAGKQNNKADY
jgi:hypothetical protein